jgi:hypothetical protein
MGSPSNFLLVPRFDQGRYRCHVVDADRELVVHVGQGATGWGVAVRQGEKWAARQLPKSMTWLTWTETHPL